MRGACPDFPRGPRAAGTEGGSPEGAERLCPALSPGGGNPARPPTRVRSSFPAAPQAAPGPATPSGAPGKRAAKAKAKATQAGKLRNSAKGKVPKSALGEVGQGRAGPWSKGT